MADPSYLALSAGCRKVRRFASLMSDDWHVTLPAWSGDDNTGAESDWSPSEQ